MKSYINILTIVIIAITMFGFIQTTLEQTDGWVITYFKMASGSIYVHAGGSQGSGYAIRVQTTADQISDSVVYGRKVSETSFDGVITIDKRSLNTSVVYMVSIILSHGDTTIMNNQGGFYLDGFSSWQSIDFNQLWSGTLTTFDSISLVIFIHPLSPLGTQIADFDNFRNGAGTIFYDGGEKGTASGVLFNDSNQNGVKDNGEIGIGNWKIYLDANSTHQDSTITNSSGNYAFTAVSRGTYTIKAESKNYWAPTTADSTIVVGDTLHWQINFGEYAPLAYYMTVNSKWNMVALPNRAYEPSVTALFPTAIYAFSYNGSYQACETLKVGVGYWLKFPESISEFILGDSINTDTITVQEGWNMIGGLTKAISANSIIVDPPTMITSQFFSYNSSYLTDDSLRPGNGYWVKADRAGQLILNAGGNAFAFNRIRIVDRGETPPAPPVESSETSSSRKSTTYMLEQNYPNPFNPATIISYQLPTDGWVTLKVYNILGEEVKTLADENQNAGFKSVEWDAGGMASGMYFYQLSIIDPSLHSGLRFVNTKKLILIR